MKSLDWFREVGGKVTPTRYSRLHVWNQGRNLWRILLTDDSGDVDVTGPAYATKAEALSELALVYEGNVA